MSAAGFLTELHRLGVRVWADGDRLRYDAPPGAVGPELLARLRDQKPGLLEFLKRAQGAASPAPSIEPLPAGATPPLSYAQQRLWLVERLAPGQAVYHTGTALRLEGRLDAEALRRSLETIVERHEALRATFEAVDGRPVQRIAAPGSFALEVRDLRPLAEEERRSEARRLVAETRGEPFDLERGPLLRARLVRLADEEHWLALIMHHIVADGWSLGVLARELTALYGAYAANHPSPLPPLAIQYKDFAAWQRDWLEGERLDAHLGYWKRQLADLPTLELPTDRPHPPVRRGHGDGLPLALDEKVSAALRELSTREGVTPFVTCLAAYAVLLGRYCGQEDVVVGAPIANRNRSEIEELIGFFVNTLVMRADLSGDPTFRELLQRIGRMSLEAYEHQDLPFEKLVDALAPRRDQSRNPLFQVAFAMQNATSERLNLAGLEAGPVPVDNPTTPFDLLLSLGEKRGRLVGQLDFNTELFDRGTIERMRDHLVALLGSIAVDPARPVSRLSMLAPGERDELLVARNRTSSDYPRNVRVHELFELEAERAPEALAVEFGEERLSYADLDARANRLAHHLIRRGVKPHDFVGLCTDRGADLIAAMLGILKAGAAYLPLDPEYPAQRLATMLEDAGARVVVTRGGAAESLPRFGGAVVHLDEDRGAIEAESGTRPALPGAADDAAYVMFTSGSTGTPKGTVVPHRGIVRLLRETDYVQLLPTDRVAQASVHSFDAATFEIWGPLLNGGQLVGVSREELLSPTALAACLRERRISVLWLTAALFTRMAMVEPSAFSGLRCVLFGGEAVDPEAVRAVLRAHPPERLLNGYGPTESTTFAVCHTAGDADLAGGSIPIGRPIANTTAYVLDSSGEPAPINTVGELHLGGDGLARGYLNRPALTAERFVPDPFAGRPGARLYRTGDWTRRRPDGTIAFLGRRDAQVKLRGFRIELGEIESSLRRDADVQEAAVVLREDAPGDKRLVAYVVAREGAAVEPVEVRRRLGDRLPDYMVPAAFVVLDALPLNANGKLDRRSLPRPDQTRPALGVDFEEPEGEAERAVAAIWQAVLDVDGVGRSDNFFELGGDSLLALQTISRLRETFGVELSVLAFFDAPTIAGVARQVERLGEQSNPDTAEIDRMLTLVEQLPEEQLAELLEAADRKEGGE